MGDKVLEWFKIGDDLETLVSPVPHDGKDSQLNEEAGVEVGELVHFGSFDHSFLADLALAVSERPVDTDLTVEHWLNDHVVGGWQQEDEHHRHAENVEGRVIVVE